MADPQVTAWLRNAGLSRFAPRFGAADISRSAFLELSSTDFDTLGVESPADRKRLNDLIAELRRESSLPPRRPSPARAHTIGSIRPRLGASDSDRERQRSSSQTSSAAQDATTSNRAQKVTGRARVSVCVRKRPLSRREISNGDRDIITTEGESALNVYELKEKVDLTKYVETHPFVFDRVFGERSSNAEVYRGTARPLVDALFSGGRSTCFAYGQTGAGKTFTMAGDAVDNPGLYALAIHDVFQRIRSGVYSDSESNPEDYYDSDYMDGAGITSQNNKQAALQVWISFFEIYGTRLHDLLNNRAKLECREDANNEVQIVGLVERLCLTEEEVMAAIDEASAGRSTGVTGANDDSSRSHAVFQIELRRESVENDYVDESSLMKESLLRPQKQSGMDNGEKRAREVGRLCFIDLAGSERGSDTANSTRVTRMEGAEINKSLLALKECIRAMGKKKDHTPFRGSKLTQVLKASFTGQNCSTVMIANVSPASSNVEHTLNTLRYSDRVKEIRKDKPRESILNNGNIGAAPRSKTTSRLPRGRRSTFSSVPTIRPSLGAVSTRSEAAGDSFDGRSDSLAVESEDRLRSSLDGRFDSAVDYEFASTPVLQATPSLTRRGSERERNRLSDRQPDRGAAQSRGSNLIRGKTLRRPMRPADRDMDMGSVTGTPMPASAAPSAPATPMEKSELAKMRETRLARRRASQTTAINPPRQSLGGQPSIRTIRTAISSAARRGESRSPDTASSSESSSGATARETHNTKRFLRHDVDSDSSRDVNARITESSVTMSAVTDESSTYSAMSSANRRTVDPMELDTSAEIEERSTRHNAGSSSQSRRNSLKLEATRGRTRQLSLVPQSPGTVDYFSGVGGLEMSDEDLLFESADIAPQQVKQPAAKERPVRKASAPKTGTSRASGPRTRSETRKQQLIQQQEEEEANSPPSKAISTALRDVIRHHHMQIEELTRLTEADTQLVAAAESGKIDPDIYAMKLELNLTQKLDMIISLKAKLGWLTPDQGQ